MSNEIIKVYNKKISCSGDHKANLGHPKVYLIIPANESSVSCSYCGQVFKYTKSNLRKNA